MKKIVMAVTNYYTSPFQVGSHHYARAFEKLGYEVLFISNPISPIHKLFANNEQLEERERIHDLAGEKVGNITYYVPKTLFTPQNKPLLSSKFILDHWYQFSYPNILNYIKEKSFDSVDILWFDSPLFAFLLDKIEYKHSILRLADYSKGFGSVSDRMAINIALSALQDKGKSKVLACPKVATLNNKEARILIGQKVPFVTTRVDASGIATQTTEFIDVGTRLVVTPTININRMITLKIKPEKSTVDEWRDAGPVISTQEVETTVLIKDNETIVIAGLIDDRDITQNTKVPFLGDIPLLGYLFKKKTWDKERDELLIFLTPRIMYE